MDIIARFLYTGTHLVPTYIRQRFADVHKGYFHPKIPRMNKYEITKFSFHYDANIFPILEDKLDDFGNKININDEIYLLLDDQSYIFGHSSMFTIPLLAPKNIELVGKHCGIDVPIFTIGYKQLYRRSIGLRIPQKNPKYYTSYTQFPKEEELYTLYNTLIDGKNAYIYYVIQPFDY